VPTRLSEKHNGNVWRPGSAEPGHAGPLRQPEPDEAGPSQSPNIRGCPVRGNSAASHDDDAASAWEISIKKGSGNSRHQMTSNGTSMTAGRRLGP
jgi:hypothetical protein